MRRNVGNNFTALFWHIAFLLVSTAECFRQRDTRFHTFFTLNAFNLLQFHFNAIIILNNRINLFVNNAKVEKNILLKHIIYEICCINTNFADYS